jgi:hypothetical protein
MAKITAYIPEPTQDYDVNNQRQILEAFNTIKNQLNFGFQKDLKDELETFNWFLIGTGTRISTKGNTTPVIIGQQLTVALNSVTVTV